MAEEGTNNSYLQGKPKFRRRVLIFLLPALFLLISFVALFLGFNYFGERLLRRYLQNKIQVESKGLYHADFKTLHLNLLTGKVELDSFELIPDTVQYRHLKSQGRIARALYRIFFSSLMIDKVHFRQVFAGKRINFRQMTIRHPLISIVGFPDTLTAKRNRWRVIYEDLYPAVSDIFNDFHIDSVKVIQGLFLSSFNAKTGSKTTGEYEFSSVLRDVSVNPFSYYNRERVFYSRDVDLVIHNFESQLADSLYSLRAEEIGFSLTRSILYGKKVSLAPNFSSARIREVRSGDLFRIDLPSFAISGIDLYRAMTGREVEISAVSLTDIFVQIFRNQPPPGSNEKKRSKKKITLAGLYTVVAKELRFIAVDSLYLKNGRFEFYGNVADHSPELRIGTVNIELGQFRLDSLTHRDKSRIFYSRAIELDLEKISLALRDGIHGIHASSVSFSTRRSLIDVQEATIFPDRKKNLLNPASLRNTMFVSLPRLTFSAIDLKKVFNSRILDFGKLVILEPEVQYTRLRAGKNPDPRFKNPEDFFEAENEDVVYDLLKKYLWVVRGEEISIMRGHVKYSMDRAGNERPLATSSFDLSMQQFLIDSVHGLNEQGYFYSRDFDLDLQSVSVVSPDSLKYLKADRVHIATRDSLIESDNLRIVKTASPMKVNARPGSRQSLEFEFSLRHLELTGLNHRKLFLENILKANQVVFDNPSVYLKSSNNVVPEGPQEETRLFKTKKFAHTFMIGRCLVRKGAVSYNGEEDIKATYFSLKDIDFSVEDALVHIPEKGRHDGMIKFDSLQLKVVPLRAVIADSTYVLEARSLEVHSYPADIILQGIKVTPLTSGTGPGRKTMLANVTIPEIRLNGFYFDRAIFDSQWLVGSIALDHPSVNLEIRQDETKQTVSWKVDPMSLVKIPPFMKTVEAGRVSIAGAEAGLVIRSPGKTRSYSFAEVMFEATGFRVDSATRSDPAGAPLFNTDDITFSSPGFSWNSTDSMYTYSIGRFGFSTGSASAFIDSVNVTPNFSREDFSGRRGYQSDRMALRIPRVLLSRLDFRKMAADRQLVAGKVSLDGAIFESYRDKRVPFPAWQRPLMPGRLVADMKFPAFIDTVELASGYAAYEEQTGDEPGRIFFDRLNATLTGFTTLPVTSDLSADLPGLDLHGSFRLMGTAPGEAWIHFQPGHPRDTFAMHALIGEFDLTEINPMLSKLLPATIVSGTSSSTDIIRINGNNAMASGLMNFRFNNLSIRLHPLKTGTWTRIEQSLLSEFANLLLSGGNPNGNGSMKPGYIYFERDLSKGFLNLVWKSMLSGIKSTVGFNSKSQKEMKKKLKK